MTGPDVAILTWLAAHRLGRLDWVARGALSALIGITIVYIGAHWSTDVLAGWAVGIAAAWACYLAASRIVPLLSGSGSGVARAAGGDPLREPGHDR